MSLLIEFVAGSTLERERDRPSHFPIHRNGPPGTFVRVGSTRVSLPTDQIVSVDTDDARVVIECGGMAFTGVEKDVLTFARVRDLRPEAELSPDRSWTMTLSTTWVAVVAEDGREVWRR
jgi:hypothetical protein